MSDRNESTEAILYVKMFGDFSVRYRGVSFIGENKKKTQFSQVMQLLLYYGEQGVDRDYLEKVLFGDRTLDDAHHAIHSVIYNTKKKLEQYGFPVERCIVTRKGRFYWNSQIPIEMDTTSFEKYCNLLNQAGNEKDASVYLWRAIQIYEGEFLEGSMENDWIQEKRVYYQERFLKLVQRAAAFLREQKAYLQLEELGQHASETAPYQQQELLLVEAMSCMGKMEQAWELYEECLKRYCSFYGKKEPEKVEDFRQKMEEQLDHPQDILDNIQESMAEHRSKIRGPYQCSWKVFREIYRINVRMMGRNDREEQLMLCTLAAEEGTVLKPGKEMKKISAQVWESICSNIRSQDVITRYGERQFLILLTNIGRAECSRIQKRIDEDFYQKNQEYRIQYCVKPVRRLKNKKEDRAGNGKKEE